MTLAGYNLQDNVYIYSNNKCMCVFLISPVPIAEPLTSELIDTPVFYNLAPRPIKYRVSVPIPTEVRPLSKALNPQLLPGRRSVGCPLTATSVCALGWVKCREHISLLVILCIIVYVTNKAHMSLIIIIIIKPRILT